MAYAIRETYAGMTNFRWYNVSSPVGRNAPNRYDDVCLVQILLAYLRPYTRVLQDPSLKPLVVDGLCGPITLAYIEAYQSHIRAGNSGYKVDGLVEPGRRWQKEAGGAGAGTMILSLNWELWQKARAAHEGIPSDARTPAVLRASLKREV